MEDEKRPDTEDETAFDPVEGVAGEDPTASRQGALFSKRFKLGRVLGEGGMAVVLEAVDVRLERTVAVKRLKQKAAERPDQRGRFFKEARIIGGLSHPGVVPIHDAGTLEDGEPFYAMEKIQGDTLFDLLRKRASAEINSRQGILRFVDIFERICQTIAFAHAHNVIHRDLKPRNIMVDRFGAVFVMDWGIAKRIATEASPHPDGQTQDGQFVGTPAYVSPEQAKGLAEATDFNTDVFTLGVILYEILTGELPFHGESNKEIIQEVLHHNPAPPRTVNRRVGRELSAICMKALAKDPRRRYASAAELAEEIRRFREFQPVSAIRPRLIDHLFKWVQRHPVIAATLGTLLVVTLLGGSYLLERARVTRGVTRQIFAIVERADQQIAELNNEADGIAAELQRPGLDATTRLSLEERLADRDARVTVMQIDNRSRLAAIIGLSIGSPNPRAVEMMRGQTFEIIDTLVEIGDYPLARAFVKSALATYERGNITELTSTEAQRLRQLLADLDAEMKVQAGGPPAAGP
jgi:serine/threonine protein kinase